MVIQQLPHNREGLIDWLIIHCRHRGIRRGLEAGQIAVLGGFSKTPPHDLPGLIIRVESPFKHKIWCVCLCLNDKDNTVNIYQIKSDDIKWEFWIGDKCKNKMYIGDLPGIYLVYKKSALGIKNEIY
jgi:hypothetical protein